MFEIITVFWQIKGENVIILSATNVPELEKQWDCWIELAKSSDLLALLEPYVSKDVTTNLLDECTTFHISWYIWHDFIHIWHDFIPCALRLFGILFSFNVCWTQYFLCLNFTCNTCSEGFIYMVRLIIMCPILLLFFYHCWLVYVNSSTQHLILLACNKNDQRCNWCVLKYLRWNN